MSISTVKLNRTDGTPWGFRLQGGKDFATPLCVQKVNAGSLAAVAGLQAGDAIVSIGGRDALSLRHKEAQEAIVRAGNNFDLVIQRGSQVWRPQVTPLAQVKTTPEGVPVATNTSLAANKKPVRHIGSNHNVVARPFPGFTGSQPTYTPGSNIIRSPLSNSSEEVAGASLSGASSRSTSGSTSPSGFLTSTSPTISLNKENAKNFLKMTLDKENVNTINVHQTARGVSPKSSSSTENLFSASFTHGSGPGHQRKYSLASNASSSSSEADHDALTRRNNEHVAPVGVKHNVKARPFAEVKVNGQQIVNAQYNTPLQLYSEDNIAETLSAQAEVLGKGCLGVNFMKNERAYDGKTSDVLRMVQEMDSNPVKEPEGEVTSYASPEKDVAQGYSFKILQQSLTEDDYDSPAGSAGPATGFRSVRAPETKVRAPGEPSPSQATKCSECERPITGVFVRVKNKSLHADCFKCATCGSSLKNVGYYNINEKLYCDVHAKQAARHHPPAPNMEPVIVKPGGPTPSGALPASAVKAAAPYKPPAGGIRMMPSAPAPAPAPMPKFTPIAPPKPEPVVAEPELPPPPAPEPVLPPQPVEVEAPEPEPVPAEPEAPVPEPLSSEEPALPSEAEAPPTDLVSEPQTTEAIPEPQPEPLVNGTASPELELAAPEAVQEPKVAPEPQVEPEPEITEVAEAAPLLAPETVVAPEPEAPPPSESVVPEPEAAPEPVAPASEPEPSRAPEETSVPVTEVSVGAPEVTAPQPIPAPQKEPAPIPAPAPAPIQVPAAPMAAPPPTFSPVKAPAAPAPQPAPFGAPAGGVDVRSHIPKKAPKPPAAAFAPVPKPAAPKPPAPTGPAPVLPKPTGLPNLGGGAMKGVAQTSGQKPAPRRGRGVMNPSNSTRIPMCADCGRQIRGPFVSALGKTWCPDHFVCSTGSCRKALIDMGFVEEQGALHCEDCYEKYLAPICGKCDKRVKGDCLNAVGKQFHPECFCCAYCGKIFGSGAFYLEDGLPYCEADWNDLFTTKCVGCGFPIEAGDRWVEALNNNYHSQCFKCSKCHKNLEGQSFFAKGGKPFCKAHAQRGL
ncbi:PDZ and LIM domain protein Zasp-like isoform X15 [Portunus trituberculatus]|uniref:PDZ and LIM domain protein Zasp-like isoform X15 n=1 Tax=Portunus trituberculatus TaxID=210409 RepID=UPI001E1CBEE7|nr:PDZ and LIM domain protein Zasp-like isoform X15 [Portunus trituberculatus]